MTGQNPNQNPNQTISSDYIAFNKIHAVIYGKPFAAKSSVAATFPKPMLVFFFDPFGKDGPYLKTPHARIEQHQNPENGQLVRILYDENNVPVTRIEYFYEPQWNLSNIGRLEPPEPQAFRMFIQRILQIYYYELNNYQSVVLDSLTSLSSLALLQETHNVKSGALFGGKGTNNQMQFYANAKLALEQLLGNFLGNFPVYTAVVAHEQEFYDEKTAIIRKEIAAIGNLSQLLPQRFTELWRLVEEPGGRRYVQTALRDGWMAHSDYTMEDMPPDFEAFRKLMIHPQ